MPKPLSCCAASFITSQSEVLPMTMPTTVVLMTGFLFLLHDLGQLALAVASRHGFQRQRIDFRCHAGATELLVALLAQRLGRGARRLEEGIDTQQIGFGANK